MIRSTEYVLSESPFIVRRTVRWSDCDPAGVVFTGRFTDYVLGAVGLFHQYMSGYAPQPFGEMHGVGTPCKGMEFEFIGTMWPGDVADIQCTVGEIRTRSYDIHCVGRAPDGKTLFKARFSPICVRLDARVGTNIPDSLRNVLIRFQSEDAPSQSPSS